MNGGIKAHDDLQQRPRKPDAERARQSPPTAKLIRQELAEQLAARCTPAMLAPRPPSFFGAPCRGPAAGWQRFAHAINNTKNPPRPQQHPQSAARIAI